MRNWTLSANWHYHPHLMVLLCIICKEDHLKYIYNIKILNMFIAKYKHDDVN